MRRALVLTAEGAALDLERIWRRTMLEAVGDVVGRYLEPDDISEVVPRPVRGILRVTYGPPKGALAYEAFLRRFEQGFRPSSVLVPGLAGTLEGFRAARIHLALVSRMTRRCLNRAVAAAGLAELFDVVLAEEGLPSDPPDPAPVLKAVARLGVGVEETLMATGDPGWSEAARWAGMAVARAAWTSFSPSGGGLRSPKDLWTQMTER